MEQGKLRMVRGEYVRQAYLPLHLHVFTPSDEVTWGAGEVAGAHAMMDGEGVRESFRQPRVRWYGVFDDTISNHE